MKPLVLRLKNIGPYADETIDFTRLDNMFLITGNTGAGKTFIFDAMTYALYGELKGNRAGQVENLKSRYATDDEECYVDFTFEVGSRKFVCHRTVPFEYINSKGNKTRKTPSVDLAKIENGELVPVSNTKKVTETDAMIAEIIFTKPMTLIKLFYSKRCKNLFRFISINNNDHLVICIDSCRASWNFINFCSCFFNEHH